MDSERDITMMGGAGAGGFLLGMLVGVTVGGLMALFFAPQPGHETRYMLRNRMGRVRDIVRSGAQDMAETAETTTEEIRRGAQTIR
jgi:gas vesicle protein